VHVCVGVRGESACESERETQRINLECYRESTTQGKERRLCESECKR